MATMTMLQALYQRIFPIVARDVAKRGGTFEEAKDVFHDALLVYYEKTHDKRLTLRHGEAAYICGIARHLWTKRYRENQRYASLDQLIGSFEGDDDSGMDWVDEATQDVQGSVPTSDKRVLRLLQVAGQKCMEVLVAFYYEKLDMEAVARRFGFSGTRSATVQKFKCLQKIKQVVKVKSLRYEDFVG
ncbi:RNA polymerase sigma factor [Parapedobacter koreensis]|uniref:DNA-directed RNA polymerase specialized sigma subunit, sigma24 family n=1 Tax=Parapedobacter koreensis TaxID=332977 RepID=A0A1H7P0U7_9SPHI|nr:sigma-70 family RNA polymerase sigma factor [Parapedobacter koreensis]SEL29490.1 DNA-directed RNA polymerase specialized sigma subunit, sigma24 family [Parapedobacter koreensis]